MLKRLLIIFVAFLTLLCAIIGSSSAIGLTNFIKVRTYAGQFTDVPTSSWYVSSVKGAYEYSLIDGKSASAFDPQGKLTVGEAIKIAACIHSIYYTGTSVSGNSSPWYTFYVDYALKNNIIIEEYPQYDAFITRLQFVLLLAAALPPEVFLSSPAMKDIVIPDINADDYSDVYMFYKAGIITGIDKSGAFGPDRLITRAEVAVVLTRVVNPELRMLMTMEEIQEKLSPQIIGVPNSAYFTLNSVASYSIQSINGYDTEQYAQVTIGDATVASCQLGKWLKGHIPLSVSSLSYGQTTIKLEIYSTKDNSFLASRIFNVNVIHPSAPTTVYYPGYYPVPDFAAYCGSKSLSNGNAYTYKVEDIASGYDTTMRNYHDLLEQNGFVYKGNKSNTDRYENSLFGWEVFMRTFTVTNQITKIDTEYLLINISYTRDNKW